MSRSVSQTVHLLTSDKKIIVVDPCVTAGTDVEVYQVSRIGTPLPKGTAPGPEHIYTVKMMRKPLLHDEAAAKSGSVKLDTLKLTRNEAGKFKQYWNAEKDGPKPTTTENKKKRTKEDIPIVVADQTTKTKKPRSATVKKTAEQKETERITKAVIAALAATTK